MSVVFEVIFGTIIEGVLELWSRFIKKRLPNHEQSQLVKVISKMLIIVTAIIIIIGTMVLLLAILFLIESYFPNLLNIVE